MSDDDDSVNDIIRNLEDIMFSLGAGDAWRDSKWKKLLDAFLEDFEKSVPMAGDPLVKERLVYANARSFPSLTPVEERALDEDSIRLGIGIGSALMLPLIESFAKVLVSGGGDSLMKEFRANKDDLVSLAKDFFGVSNDDDEAPSIFGPDGPGPDDYLN